MTYVATCCMADPTNLTPRKHQAGDTTFKINIVEVDGVHR